jgi:hypothetical protein
MLEWRDVIDLVVQALGTDAQSLVVLLEFLTVLPEEVAEGRKVSLSVSSCSSASALLSEAHHTYHTQNRRRSLPTDNRSFSRIMPPKFFNFLYSTLKSQVTTIHIGSRIKFCANMRGRR